MNHNKMRDQRTAQNVVSNIYKLNYQFCLQCPAFHKVLDKPSNPIKGGAPLTEGTEA